MSYKKTNKNDTDNQFKNKKEKYTNDDYAQKNRFAKRLKELRESKKLSHDKLTDALSDKGIEICTKSLKNYEVTEKIHSSYNSGLGISLYNLKSLADFFGVSIDYLLGNTMGKYPEYEVINKITGLSNGSIDTLKNLKEFSETTSTEKVVIPTLNLFLSFSKPHELLTLFLNMQDFFVKRHQEADICAKKLNELYNKYMNNENIKDEHKTYLKFASKYCNIENWITKTKDEILQEINIANKEKLQIIDSELLTENLKVFNAFFAEFMYEKNDYEKNIDFSLYKVQNQFIQLVKNI